MVSIWHKYRFWVFVILAIILDCIPFVKWPFLWSETFFHEISHGLAALITGGDIQSIRLDYYGSGLCVSSGGVRFVIAFAGYFGSALWGMLIFLLADSIRHSKAVFLLVAIVGLQVVTILFWAQGVSTYIILCLMTCLFVLAYKFTSSVILKGLLQFTGIYVVLDAIRSPLALIDGHSVGDGAALATITFVPEILWVITWFLIGIACLYLMFVASSPSRGKNTNVWY